VPFTLLRKKELHMTSKTNIPGPQISALLLFRRLAPTCAEELSKQMHRAGIHNSNDVVDVLATGLRAFARKHGISSAAVFSQAWPEALSVLKNSRSEEDWTRLLPQEASAFKAPPRQISEAGMQMFRVLEAAMEIMQMAPRTTVGFGVWIVTAVVIGHSGPLDADLSLEELAHYF